MSCMDTKDDVLPSEPISNWRCPGSGPGSVKWVTGHVAVGDQASHGKPATGINIWKTLNIGTWNVRGLIQTGKLAIVEKEVSNYPIVGLSETHWRGSGHFETRNKNIVFYSGNEDSTRNGVGIIVNKKLEHAIREYRAINDRIIMIRLRSNPTNINIIQVYLPTTDARDENVDEMYSQLEQLLDTLPNREITMIIGDYNAKVGNDAEGKRVTGKYGLGTRNARGERLLQFCTENDFFISNTGFQHHARRLYTWTSPGGQYRNQIDYILIKSRWKTSVKNVRTFPSKDCNSDHQFLAAQLRTKISKPKPSKPTVNLWCLKNSDSYRERAKSAIAKINSSANTIETADSLWTRTKKAILDAAQQERQRVTEQRKAWITQETWNRVERRKQLKVKGLRNNDDKEKYATLSRDIRQACRKDKNKYLNDICLEIEQHTHKNETRDMFKKIKQITRSFTPKHTAIRSEDGALLTDKSQIKERWKNYCKQLMADNSVRDNRPQTIEFAEREPSVLREEVTAAVRKLKTNKSPGEDNIVSEMITALGDSGIDVLHRICQLVWNEGKWPEDWTKSIYVPLYKKGSREICDNYRTIALISHASKVLLQIISERIKPHILSQLPPEQAGFVPGRGTREQILNIRQIIEKVREFNVPTYLCFIDYTKAFDCVQWHNLWRILEEMGVPRHLISLIKSLYGNNRAYVRVENELTDPFQVEKGVRQGCILSPLLFNIYGEWVMRRALEDWTGGVTLGGKKFNNLRYADDTTAIAASEEELCDLIRRIEHFSKEIGLRINKKKTKIMIVDRANNNRPEIKKINNIDTVNTFIYLGSLISNEGGSTEEIKRRSSLAKEAMTKLTNIWRSHEISLATKTRLVRSLVFSIFLYGSECWSLKATDKRRIDALEMFCWRRMLRISWTQRRTNESILQQIKPKKRLRTIVAENIAKFFGHVVRGNGLERLTVEGMVAGKRPRGRSPTRYTDLITSITGQSLSCTFRMTENREEWRHIVENNS